MAKTPGARMGRPPIEPAKRLIQRSIRLTAEDWDYLEAAGGVAWVREMLRQVREAPRPAHAPRRKATRRALRLASLFVID